MNLSRREEARESPMPSEKEARSRQTAYEATEHWWKSRITRLKTDWATLGIRRATSDYDRGYRQACLNCAGAVDELIAERAR